MQTPLRLVALDLDGTLLDSGKNLPARNRAALEAAAARVLLVVPTTGRFFGMMPPCVRDLPFVRYAVTVNGAEVFDRETGEALVRAEIPREEAIDVMRTLGRFDAIYDCYRDDWGWMTAALQAKAADYAPDAHYLKMIREFRRPVPDLPAFLAEGGSDVQKVMLFARHPADLPAIRAAVAARHPTLVLTSSTPNNLEINAPAAHKGEALRRFAARLGFGMENVAAFGDGLNDLTMVRDAGLGVAMANAHPDVRAAASFVAPSNDECGVAAALERFLLSPTPEPIPPRHAAP